MEDPCPHTGVNNRSRGAHLHHATYRPTTTTLQAVRSAHTTKDVTTFKAKHSRLTVIFYPRALVQPASYALWAQQVAQAR